MSKSTSEGVEQLNVFDLFDEDPPPIPAPAPRPPAPKPVPAPTPVVSDEELAAGRLMKMRPNFVKLGWNAGTNKNIFSVQTGQVQHGEEFRSQKTEYLIPVPLPEDWMKDPAQHFKARELEKQILAENGFSIGRTTAGNQTWEVINEALAARWKTETCLCQDCRWLATDCHCQVRI